MKELEDREMTLIEHLTELRARLIRAFLAIGIGFVITYSFSLKIFEILKKPVGELVFLSPTEAFFTRLKVSLFAGFLLALPYILWEVWGFIAIALRRHERKYTVIFIISALAFFILGGSFGFFIILPLGLKFLLGYGLPGVNPMISVGKYVSFVIGVILVFGTVFEMPLFFLFLAKLGVVTPKFMSKNRPYIVLIIFILAALLTPPDVVTQVLLALPMLLLYEISLVLVKIVVRKKEKDKEDQ